MAAFRFRQRRTRRWWYAGATLVAAAFFAVFFVVGAGASSTGLNIVGPSQFEVGDGNMTIDASSGNTDWNCFFPSSNGNGGNTCSKSSGATNTAADGSSSGEVTWKPGQKFDTSCATLKSGSVPNKDDFTHIGTFTEFDGSNNLYFDGSAIRAVSNGNASGDVEFNQAKAGDQAGCNGIPRTNGDIMIAYDFLGGGNKPTSLSFHTLTWTTNPSDTCLVKTDSPPCWTGGNAVDPSLYDGQSNTQQIQAGDNGMSNSLLDIGQFAEFGINLTGAFAPTPLPCFASQTWESRTSGSSFTSNPEDIETISHPTCGTIIIRKATIPTPDQYGGSFGFSTTGGLSPSTFSLVDQGSQDYGSSVSAGSYTVTESATAGYTFTSIDCSASDRGNGSTTSATGSTLSIGLAPGDTIDCTYYNTLNTAPLTTKASNTTFTVLPGVPVNDTATVTGSLLSGPPPSGEVTFYLCGPSTTALSGCSSSDSSRTQIPDNSTTVTLSGASDQNVATATSSDVNTSSSKLAGGYYCFEASWPGDTNYLVPQDETNDATNECFFVRIGTTTTTTPSVGQNGSTTYGDKTVTDTAVVQANDLGGGTPTGDVTFYLCSPTTLSDNSTSTCNSTIGTQVGDPVTLGSALSGYSPPAAQATSAQVDNSTGFPNGVNQVGDWCWAAYYTPSGANGANYIGSHDARSTECFTVTDTTTSASHQVWYPNDSASVSAAHGEPISGTLTLQLWTDGNCGQTSGHSVSGQSYSSGDQTNQTTINVASKDLSDAWQTSYGVDGNATVSWLVTFTSDNTSLIGSSSHCESSSVANLNN